MENKNPSVKKRFGVLDFFIILVLVLCVLGIGMRFVFKLNQPQDESFVAVDTEEYYVSYISRNVRNTVPEYLTEDTLFRFASSNDEFGYPFRTPTVQPAEKRYVGSDGTQYKVPNLPNDDRTVRNDIFGIFKVKGKLNADGLLMVDGSTNIISLNKEYTLRSDILVLKFTVVGITKAP
ncbi:MAG: hypothetical protein IKG80_03730 [Clostridia bacterium]|nr:hypothetical protein [Clostridia bacterium]